MWIFRRRNGLNAIGMRTQKHRAAYPEAQGRTGAKRTQKHRADGAEPCALSTGQSVLRSTGQNG